MVHTKHFKTLVDHPLVIIPIMDVAHIPSLPASKITSGVFGVLRIPDLDAAKIASGILDALRIPAISPLKLDAVDSPSDKEAPTYNEATGKFEWIEVAKKGISDLSELNIDIDKDWAGFILKNLGAPVEAGDVYSMGNTIDVLDIPNLDAGKITSGVFDDALLPDGIARDSEVDDKISTHSGISDAHHSVHVKTLLDHPLDIIPLITPTKLDAIDEAGDGEVPTYNLAEEKFEWKAAAGITNLSDLVIDVDKDWATKIIKNLGAPVDAGDVYSKGNAIDVDDIPSLDAAKIVSGVFDVLRIPDLDAAKIASGILDALRIPAISPLKLDAVDSPADGEVPTYNEEEEKFEWLNLGAAGEPNPVIITMNQIKKDYADQVLYDGSALGAKSKTGGGGIPWEVIGTPYDPLTFDSSLFADLKVGKRYTVKLKARIKTGDGAYPCEVKFGEYGGSYISTSSTSYVWVTSPEFDIEYGTPLTLWWRVGHFAVYKYIDGYYLLLKYDKGYYEITPANQGFSSLKCVQILVNQNDQVRITKMDDSTVTYNNSVAACLACPIEAENLPKNILPIQLKKIVRLAGLPIVMIYDGG